MLFFCYSCLLCFLCLFFDCVLSFWHSSCPTSFPSTLKLPFPICLSLRCFPAFSLIWNPPSLVFFLFYLSDFSLFTFILSRGPKAALLCVIWSSSACYPHPVHQPLSGLGHHLYHLHQCHHHVSGALQPATGDHTSRWWWKGSLGVGVGVRQILQSFLRASE